MTNLNDSVVENCLPLSWTELTELLGQCLVDTRLIFRQKLVALAKIFPCIKLVRGVVVVIPGIEASVVILFNFITKLSHDALCTER